MSAEQTRKLAELKRFFGNQLDEDVLVSILEVAGGDVSQAIQFLQASNEQLNAPDYVDPMKVSKDNLPKNYLQMPLNWKNPKGKEKKMELKGLMSVAAQIRTLMFNEASTLADHLKFAKDKGTFSVYVAVVMVLLNQNCELNFHSKWKILGALFSARCWNQTDYLLYETKQFNLPELLKALKVMDMQRGCRSINKKIERLKKGGAKARTIQKLRGKITEMEKDMVPEEVFKTSVSGALARRIRKWAGKFTESELAFFAIQMPKEPWKHLADIVHFSPNDFKLKHFLPCAFGTEPPKESLINICKTLTVKNVEELCSKFEIPYSYLRKNIPVLTTKVKALVAKYERIDTLIWYYEEFTAKGAKEVIDKIIDERLNKGDYPTYNYGKLLERIMYFKMNGSPFYDKLIPLAQAKLDCLNLPLNRPFLIFGDASFSMDVSIRTSTIIASFVACLTDAKLFFFNDAVFSPKYQPKNIENVLDIALNTRTNGLTAPACILHDYYQKKKKVKIMLVVTDEIENVMSEGIYFAQLFYKYYTQVYPAKLVLVSFLENPSANEDGRMTKALKKFGIEPIVFVMHSIRPDLTKLDKLIGLLSLETDAFFKSVKEYAKIYREAKEGEGFNVLLKKMKKTDVKKIDPQSKKLERELTKMLVEEDPEQPKEADRFLRKEDEKKMKEEMNLGVPKEFICPITLEIMKEPSIASDGMTYDKEAILKWIKTKKTSPITGAPLKQLIVFPNFQLQSRIKEFLEKKEKDKKDEGAGK